jgi:hypothetical protein
VTTHLRSCARLGLTHFASTLVVCGGFLLLAPAEASAADVAAARTFAFAIVTSPDTPPHQLSAGALDSDDDDSSDDDDDDDVVGGRGDAAIAVGSCHTICSGEASSPIYVDVESWVSHKIDGHSLRGPPRVEDGASDVDSAIDFPLDAGRMPAAADAPVATVQTTPSGMFTAGGADHQFNSGSLGSDDDDSSADDDDDDALGGDAAIESGSARPGSTRHISQHFRVDPVPPVSPTSDGHSLRAPPQ